MNFSLVELAAKFYRDKKDANTILMPAVSDEAFETLLHVAAGDEEWMKLAKTKVDINIADLKKAALMLAIQLSFKTTGNAYTIFGLNERASESKIKTHYRLMMRLFHPDRSFVDIKTAKEYASQLNAAIENIRQSRQIKINTTTSSSSLNIKPPVDLWWDRPTSYHPDSSFFKRLREGILNYSLMILIFLVIAILGLMYVWRETHPIIHPEDSRFYGEAESKSQEETPKKTDIATLESTDHQKEESDSITSNEDSSAHPEASPIISNQDETIKKTQTLKTNQSAIPHRLKKASPLKTDLVVGEDPSIKKIGEAPLPVTPTPAPTSLPISALILNHESKEILKEELPPEKILSQQDMRNLMYDFVDDYNRGKLEALTALMSDNLRTNDNMNKEAWRLYYAKVFAETSKREMSLRNLQLNATSDGMKAKTHYEVKLFYANSQTLKMIMGTLDIEAHFENKQPKMTGFLNNTIGQR